MKLKVIITGASGMVGEGVLHECLQHPDVESVLVVGRKHCGTTHPKLKEVLHQDFFDVRPISAQLSGYNACYFCLGVSSVGMKEDKFSHLTYDLTTHFAGVVLEQNPGMVFCYVSGSGTDSSEKGRTMWARVKGRTENALLGMGFKNAYMYRPGYMQPTKGLNNTLKYYAYLSWAYPAFKVLFPGFVCTLADLGQSMIQVTTHGFEGNHLEVRDIVRTARKI